MLVEYALLLQGIIMSNDMMEVIHQALDDIVVGELSCIRDELSESIGRRHAIFWLDPKEDDKEIQRHIDALNLILAYYKS